MKRQAEIAPEEQKMAQVIGQAVVDRIGDWHDQGLTLNVVLVMLCSVAAHYIGGIPDQELRQQVYQEFGANLAKHLAELDTNRDLQRSSISLVGPGDMN